jgi:hypothetical protein
MNTRCIKKPWTCSYCSRRCNFLITLLFLAIGLLSFQYGLISGMRMKNLEFVGRSAISKEAVNRSAVPSNRTNFSESMPTSKDSGDGNRSVVMPQKSEANLSLQFSNLPSKSGCLDVGPRSGWLDAHKPYSSMQCMEACDDLGYKYFTVAKSDKNCKCNAICEAEGKGHASFEIRRPHVGRISKFVQDVARPLIKGDIRAGRTF